MNRDAILVGAWNALNSVHLPPPPLMSRDLLRLPTVEDSTPNHAENRGSISAPDYWSTSVGHAQMQSLSGDFVSVPPTAPPPTLCSTYSSIPSVESLTSFSAISSVPTAAISASSSFHSSVPPAAPFSDEEGLIQESSTEEGEIPAPPGEDHIPIRASFSGSSMASFSGSSASSCGVFPIEVITTPSPPSKRSCLKTPGEPSHEGKKTRFKFDLNKYRLGYY